MTAAATVPASQLAVRRRVEQVMGMPVSLALRGRHASTRTGRRAWDDVLAALREIDLTFSTYRSDSVISRLGRGELAETGCSPDVQEVLAIGRAAEDQSNGRFSIWLPESAGFRRLDPSGVVKGWAITRCSTFLAALDDTDFCLSAGGDMVCRVLDPVRPDWRIGVEHPHHPDRLIAVIPVRTAAVATSGTAHRGHHILDPRSGRPPEGVASVTVIASSLTWADIDATAAYAHGSQAAEWLRTRPGRSALIVWPDATTTVVDGRQSGW